MDFSLGQIVYSKSGRDRGRAFIVVVIEDEYLYLADGVLRLIAHPKKKKKKHVQITHEIAQGIKQKLEMNAEIQNKELEKAISEVTVGA